MEAEQKKNRTKVTTYDEDNKIDTWLLLFASFQQSDGSHVSIVTLGGNSNICNVPHLDPGMVSLANQPILHHLD